MDEPHNRILTETGPETPGGNLLRRYWHPIGLASEIAPRTKKRVRLLTEDLVLFRDDSNNLGLVTESCIHRGASLYYGFVEGACIRCPYHGWLFDRSGECKERPFEQTVLTSRTLKQPAYRVQEMAGIVFAYLGPWEAAPLLPAWDILAREDGTRYVEVQDDIKCNWFQIQENAVDVTHTYYLHSKMFQRLGLPDKSGFGLSLKQYGFQPFEWGILKSWEYAGDRRGWGNPLVFPNMLRIMTEMHWRVPLDDETTRIFWVGIDPTHGASRAPGILRQPPRKNQSGAYTLDTFMSQDAMAWETQGRILNREREHLGASDIGISLFRKMFLSEVGRVEAGKDPLGTVRDKKSDNFIDLRKWMGGYLPMSCAPDPTTPEGLSAEEIFDGDHRMVEIPARSRG